MYNVSNGITANALWTLKITSTRLTGHSSTAVQSVGYWLSFPGTSHTFGGSHPPPDRRHWPTVEIKCINLLHNKQIASQIKWTFTARPDTRYKKSAWQPHNQYNLCVTPGCDDRRKRVGQTGEESEAYIGGRVSRFVRIGTPAIANWAC